MKRNFNNLEKILRKSLPVVGTIVALTLASPKNFLDSVPDLETVSISPEILSEESDDLTLGYHTFSEYNFYGTELADKNSVEGRIQRTLRWAPIYSTIENLYGIPKNTLAAMIMEESYGDPLQANIQEKGYGDGGFGIVHIQRKTAKQLGMKVLGEESERRNRMYSDTTHGRELKEMLDTCDYDFACAQEKDDRAHIIYALDVAARILAEGKRKYGTWDKGIEYFRSPAKVGESVTEDYVERIRIWKNALNSKKTIHKAASDFESRNNYDFGDYLLAWYDMNNNWGLQKYKQNQLNPPSRLAE